jgi:hypothetical protein
MPWRYQVSIHSSGFNLLQCVCPIQYLSFVVSWLYSAPSMMVCGKWFALMDPVCFYSALQFFMVLIHAVDDFIYIRFLELVCDVNIGGPAYVEHILHRNYSFQPEIKFFFNRTYRLFLNTVHCYNLLENYCCYEIQIHKELCEFVVEKSYC